MRSKRWLWNELHDLFDTDDGSLPELRVNFRDPRATAAGYALLRRRAGRVVTENPRFWSNPLSAECELDSVPNAATLVVAGDAEPFHVLLGGIATPSTVIPDLGVFVFPNQLALDYRMGPDWGPSELDGLFELLVELTNLDTGASVSLEDGALPEVTARVQRAWQRWAEEPSA